MRLVYSVSREEMEVTSNPEIEMTEACLFCSRGELLNGEWIRIVVSSPHITSPKHSLYSMFTLRY